MKKIYFNPTSAIGRDNVFRGGQAWHVDPDPSSPVENESSVPKLLLDAGTIGAMFTFGFIDKLQHLPMAFGPIDQFEEALLFPSGLEEGAKILRASCEELPQHNQDLFCSKQIGPDSEKVEYHMVIDMWEAKKSIRKLAAFFEEAVVKKRGVQLWF